MTNFLEVDENRDVEEEEGEEEDHDQKEKENSNEQNDERSTEMKDEIWINGKGRNDDRLMDEGKTASSNTDGKTNLFALYAKVFRVMLAKWRETLENADEEEKSRRLDELVLPSNEQWRFQVYYRLVDLQREIDQGTPDTSSKMKLEESEADAGKQRKYPRADWEPATEIASRRYPLRAKRATSNETIAASLLSAITETKGSMTEARIEPGWRIRDIILAARVLQGDNVSPDYANEAEMRRVFGLVYDVLRYKEILNRALWDVGFWYRYAEHKKRERIVWLMLYDMQGRKFSGRGDSAAVRQAREKAFREASIKDIEDALVETRTRLAASVSRLRIGGSALRLDELLPSHLRSAEGVDWSEDGGSLASGWVNTSKIASKSDFITEMAKLKLILCTEECSEKELDEDHYVFDPICPKVVNLHEKAREKLAMSDLVIGHGFVFLERCLCLGAAALAQTIRTGRLCGPVVLTHSIAPRHTAYLAGLLADIDDAGRLLAFGAGEDRHRYEQYLEKLGFTTEHCRVFSESYTSPPPLAELERATVMLATPPCSYTGVRDVVDLAVARGGDTKLLESLTNIDIDFEQPKALLAEQLMSLKHALTRPNVQLLMYEAHSILPAETFQMVNQVVRYANQMASDKFTREHPAKKISKSPSKEAPARRSGKSGKRGLEQKTGAPGMQSENDGRSEDDERTGRTSCDFEVPDTDTFEIGSPADIYDSESMKWFNDRCYLAIVKRKEMMQFNSLFMIKVAESKGLFGDVTKQQDAAQALKDQQEAAAAAAAASEQRQNSGNSVRKHVKRPKIEIERIAAATHSSMIRSAKRAPLKNEEIASMGSCPRRIQRIIQDEMLSSSQIPRSTGPISRFSEVRRASTSSIRSTKGHDSSTNNRITKNVKENSERDSKLLERFFNGKNTSKNSELEFLPENHANPLRPLPNCKNANYIGKINGFFGQKTPLKQRDSSTFSFGYGAVALNRSTRKISLSEISDEPEKENPWRVLRTSSASYEPRKSRIYHPGGALRVCSRSKLDANFSKKYNNNRLFSYFYPEIARGSA